jgi:hypothetical protein
MSEYEIKSLYKIIKKDSQYKPFVNKIDNVKKSLTPKQLLDLQSLLVNASNHENTLKNSILMRLDKKINELDLQNQYSNDEIKQLDTYRKISRSIPINRRILKNKKTQRKDKPPKKILSSIIEETDSQTKSTGGRKTRKKRSNHSTW